MLRLAVYSITGALVGALGVYLLAEGVPEGAIMGLVLGGSLGVLVAVRKGAGGKAASFEYEAAGLHDNNLTTTARRNLVREAFRSGYSHQLEEMAEKTEKTTPHDRSGLTGRERKAE